MRDAPCRDRRRFSGARASAASCPEVSQYPVGITRTAVPVSSWTGGRSATSSWSSILDVAFHTLVRQPNSPLCGWSYGLHQPTDDVMNGGWWPRSRDPAAELPALATAVADRLGVVCRIALNTDAWTSWPRHIVIGGAKVRLDWCTGDAHTIRLTSDDASHLDLLAIPPDTPTILALTCLARAESPDVRSSSHHQESARNPWARPVGGPNTDLGPPTTHGVLSSPCRPSRRTGRRPRSSPACQR